MSTDSREDHVTRRFLVSGKVQGVYFRQSTRLEAQRLGLGGMARNLPDGCVEVIAYGEPAAIDALMTWLSVGPPLAKVAQVKEVQAPSAAAAPARHAHFSVE